MKNIAPITANIDKTAYQNVIKGTRKPHKPVLTATQKSVETKMDDYANCIISGSALPLGFTGITHDYHYSLYDSNAASVVKLKSELVADYLDTTCPYCLADTVSHIDHFLPRVFFPEFSISLQNILMSCDICNSKHKRETWGNGNAQNVIHPRYNLLPNVSYLDATVTYAQNALIVGFQIIAVAAISALIQRHFTLMNLNARYIGKVTNEEVPKIKNILLEEPTVLRKTKRLRRFVTDQISAHPLNSWQKSFYTALKAHVGAIAAGGLS